MEEEEFTQSTTIDTLKQYWWMVLLMVFWVIFRNRMGVVYSDGIDAATFWFWLTFIAALLFMGSERWLKNLTPKLIYPGGHTTTTGDFASMVGNWIVYKRECIRAWELDIEGNKGVHIAPKDSVSVKGRNIILSATQVPVEMDQLPPIVRREIMDKGYNPPYYFGYFDPAQLGSEVKIDDPDFLGGLKKVKVDYLVGILDEAYKYIKNLEDMLKNKFQSSEEVVAASSRLRQMASEESPLASLKRKLTEENKGD